MEKFYFTYGTDAGYPFRGGWSLIHAPDLKSAIQIFKEHHPPREGSTLLNCADYYRAEYFESHEIFRNGNFGGFCHEILGLEREVEITPTEQKVDNVDLKRTVPTRDVEEELEM